MTNDDWVLYSPVERKHAASISYFALGINRKRKYPRLKPSYVKNNKKRDTSDLPCPIFCTRISFVSADAAPYYCIFFMSNGKLDFYAVPINIGNRICNEKGKEFCDLLQKLGDDCKRTQIEDFIKHYYEMIFLL